MKALLHIGSGKTGTTSIQEYMSVNRQRLREQGIHYPVTLGAKNHRRLPAIVQKDDRAARYFREQGLRDAASRAAAREAWWQEFRAEIASAGDCDRCLISAEHLWDLGAQEVAALRSRLATLFDEVRILAYLRDPVDYAMSMYDTALKIGSTNLAPASPVAGGPTDYAHVLKSWQGAFGRDRMTVRLFDRAELVGGDILQDFVHAAGIDAAGFAEVKVKNPSLGVLGQQILLRVNRRLPRHRPDGSPNRMRGDIVGLFERFFADGARTAPDPALVAECQTVLAGSNEWVRQTFFPGRDRLFPARSYGACPAPSLDERDLDRMADLVVELWQAARKARRAAAS